MDGSGALYWPDRNILIIADAHLEKGSFFARRGFHLPPYDSFMTLTKLLAVRQKYEARKIMILGDFFHDNHAHQRMSRESTDLFEELKKYDLVWIKGNHDIAYKPEGIEVLDEFEDAGIVFRHEAENTSKPEISGHYHPKSDFVYKGRQFRERCFVDDGLKLMLPAFGAYTGGLSIKDKAIRKLFGSQYRQYIVINDSVVYIPDESASG